MIFAKGCECEDEYGRAHSQSGRYEGQSVAKIELILPQEASDQDFLSCCKLAYYEIHNLSKGGAMEANLATVVAKLDCLRAKEVARPVFISHSLSMNCVAFKAPWSPTISYFNSSAVAKLGLIKARYAIWADHSFKGCRLWANQKVGLSQKNGHKSPSVSAPTATGAQGSQSLFIRYQADDVVAFRPKHNFGVIAEEFTSGRCSSVAKSRGSGEEAQCSYVITTLVLSIGYDFHGTWVEVRRWHFGPIPVAKMLSILKGNPGLSRKRKHLMANSINLGSSSCPISPRIPIPVYRLGGSSRQPQSPNAQYPFAKQLFRNLIITFWVDTSSVVAAGAPRTRWVLFGEASYLLAYRSTACFMVLQLTVAKSRRPFRCPLRHGHFLSYTYSVSCVPSGLGSCPLTDSLLLGLCSQIAAYPIGGDQIGQRPLPNLPNRGLTVSSPKPSNERYQVMTTNFALGAELRHKLRTIPLANTAWLLMYNFAATAAKFLNSLPLPTDPEASRGCIDLADNCRLISELPDQPRRGAPEIGYTHQAIRNLRIVQQAAGQFQTGVRRTRAGLPFGCHVASPLSRTTNCLTGYWAIVGSLRRRFASPASNHKSLIMGCVQITQQLLRNLRAILGGILGSLATPNFAAAAAHLPNPLPLPTEPEALRTSTHLACSYRPITTTAGCTPHPYRRTQGCAICLGF